MVREVFTEVAREDPELILQRLEALAERHAGNLAQEDDRTLVVLRIR